MLSGSDLLYGTTSETFFVVRCARCRLSRLFPRPKPHELLQYYPQGYWFDPDDTAAGRWEERYRRWVLFDHVRFAARALQESGLNAPVLDVGCGGGLFLRLMAERGYRGVGLDFSLDASAVAWQRQGVPALCATLSQAPFPPGTFALITMFHVLEHLYDPAAYVCAAHELLHPQGRLIIQVPNISSWQFLLMGERWNGIDIPRHFYHFRPEDLEILLDQCGFEVTRKKFFSLRDNPAGFATSLAPHLDPMSRRVRRVPESPRRRFWKDVLYFLVLLAATPLALLEAACDAGSTVMLEARKKPSSLRPTTSARTDAARTSSGESGQPPNSPNS